MKKEYILVVEDSKSINRGLSELIKRRLGLEVLSAFNFAECEKYIDSSKENIVLAVVDITLPDCPDSAAIDYSLKNRIPTIVMTGNFSEDLRDRLFKKNVTDYYLKQNMDSINQVVSGIRRVLKNRDAKVLVVDDSKMYISFYKQVLTKQLLQPFFAKNGKQALEILERERDIKIVLTDYNMPDMDGLELTKEIRKKILKENLSIIAISDSADKSISANFLKTGANDFISKPFSKEELITRLSSNLEILDMFQVILDRANKDFMTGMFNRRYFFDEGKEQFDITKKKNKDLYVGMVDIDKFKTINDTYGHDVGDVAIIEVGKILERNLEQIETTIARFGGEEFCIILSDITKERCQEVFETIREDFEKNIIKIDDIQISYTVSIGIIKVSQESLDTAVTSADKNLYEAKETGRNKVVFS